MLEHDRIYILEGIDVNKTNASKECDICHYCYFLDKDFQYEPNLCTGCNELMQKSNFNDTAVIHKDIFACLFSIHNIISLSCHEQVSLREMIIEFIIGT